MKKRSKSVWIVAILLTLCFIFSRSMKSIADSGAESGRILEILAPILEYFVGKGKVTDLLVRKLAHFCEFGILGFEFMAYSGKPALWPFFTALLCALCDETIQLFYNRGSQVSDVWLDFLGAFCGIWMCRLLLTLIRRRKRTHIQ